MSNNLIEGEGTFKDYNGSEDGSPVFQTQDKDEWEEYCKEKKLTRSGNAPCVICNTNVEFTNLQVGKNAVCDDCKGSL